MLIQGSFLSSLLNLLPQKGMIKMALTIYAVVATVVAVVAIIKAVKWKIATKAMMVYCMKNFRMPTYKELADCSKEAAGKTIRFK
jgi:hypothetical protein|nr:MAG TPA: hypothetical protein [Caudoviricetes sp.]